MNLILYNINFCTDPILELCHFGFAQSTRPGFNFYIRRRQTGCWIDKLYLPASRCLPFSPPECILWRDGMILSHSAARSLFNPNTLAYIIRAKLPILIVYGGRFHLNSQANDVLLFQAKQTLSAVPFRNQVPLRRPNPTYDLWKPILIIPVVRYIQLNFVTAGEVTQVSIGETIQFSFVLCSLCTHCRSTFESIRLYN